MNVIFYLRILQHNSQNSCFVHAYLCTFVSQEFTNAIQTPKVISVTRMKLVPKFTLWGSLQHNFMVKHFK